MTASRSVTAVRRAARRAVLAVAAGAALALAAAPAAWAQGQPQTDPGAALRARHATLRDALQKNDFKRPLVLESQQTAGDLKGDVYAVVDHPFERVDAALRTPAQWCDVMMLHLNVKHCRAGGSAGAQTLLLNIGKKYDQPLEDTYRVQFAWRSVARSADYLQIQLRADEGPLGTRDYRIVLEAVALDAGHSFIHMTYAYGYGMAARIAMQGYLSTLGRGKVGFSVVGREPDGKPVYVDNVRGVAERNTMRYYLAIDAALDNFGLPAAEQQDKRLREWFAATERYPRQLHEIDQAEYLEMKKKEMKRQREGS